jgi:hypothetical protein
MENRKEKNNTWLIVLLVLIIMGLIGYICYKEIKEGNKPSPAPVEEKKEDKEPDVIPSKEEKKEDEKPVKVKETDTFSLDTESGVAYVTGYATIEELRGDGLEEDENEKVDYVLFHITSPTSSNFLKWIKSIEGNAFVGEKAIGLGCVENNIIKYVNSSDKLGDKEFTLTKNDSTMIINSTKDSPVTLKLERLQFTSGSGAPLCYSHITYVSVEK